MISDGKGMIIDTEIALIWQPSPKPDIFMPFSFSEQHGESGIGEQELGVQCMPLTSDLLRNCLSGLSI